MSKITKHVIVLGKNNRDYHYDLVIDPTTSNDGNLELNHNDSANNPAWKKAKAIKIVSDGNGIDVFIYTDSKGKRCKTLRLDYSEAQELGIALVEYTKFDPHANDPMYEVYEKALAFKKKPKKKKGKLDDYTVALP